MHPRAARPDCLEAPFADQVAERPVQQLHVDLSIRHQRVARRELRLQHAARHFERRDAFRGGDLLHLSADAPRQKFGVALDIGDQRKKLLGRIGQDALLGMGRHLEFCPVTPAKAGVQGETHVARPGFPLSRE